MLTLNGRPPAWTSRRAAAMLKTRGLDSMKSLCISIEDEECENITPFFAQCFQAIDAVLDAGEGVLVHCTAGRSRSATVAIAYLRARCVSRVCRRKPAAAQENRRLDVPSLASAAAGNNTGNDKADKEHQTELIVDTFCARPCCAAHVFPAATRSSLTRDCAGGHRCGFTLDGAYRHVKSLRPWIQPNRAFVGQLRSFDMVSVPASERKVPTHDDDDTRRKEARANGPLHFRGATVEIPAARTGSRVKGRQRSWHHL